MNCAGPILVTKALRKALNAGRRGSSDRPASVVANLSARVGSISDNRLGGVRAGGWLYRLSKAALNQATVTCARELRRQRTICVALQLGTTDTGLSKPFRRASRRKNCFPSRSRRRSSRHCGWPRGGRPGRFIDWAGTMYTSSHATRRRHSPASPAALPTLGVGDRLLLPEQERGCAS